MERLVLLKIAVFGALPTIFLIGLMAYFILPEKSSTKEVETSIDTQEIVNAQPAIHIEVIGKSVEGREITATTFGDGPTQLLFVGGMHGGYEWNSSLLAYDMIEQFTEYPEMVPPDITVSIIPALNPDGLYVALGKEGTFEYAEVPTPSTRVAEGRFNARGVDLNRNFDCKWAPESSWRGKTVSAGDEAFSEPEAQALRNFVGEIRPQAVVFWHSKANNVYASECTQGVLPLTLDLMNTYADAAGYGKVEKFDAYPITGDAEGWLASIGIPAVTVELQSAERTEWTRNLAGMEAVLEFFSEKTK